MLHGILSNDCLGLLKLLPSLSTNYRSGAEVGRKELEVLFVANPSIIITINLRKESSELFLGCDNIDKRESIVHCHEEL